MSLDNLNNTNREFRSLQNSFRGWEAGEPSADVWENLEADLAVSAVWDRLDETLEANGSSADQALVDSYENWSPNNSGDGWSRLEEQLSRERVWTRLNTTLSYPVTTSIPWVKMAAASLLFIFTAFYTDHQFSAPDNESQLNAFAFEGTISGSNENTDRNQTANGTENTGVDGNQPIPANNGVNQLAQNTNVQNRLVVANNTGNNPDVNKNSVQNNGNTPENNQLIANQNPVDNNRSNGTTSDPENDAVNTNANDLAALDQLPAREVTAFGETGTIADFDFMPFKAPFRPRFSVLVGGQFAFINEKNRSAFSSSLPSMGIAADMQYHAYLRNWRFTQDLGFSQYAQSNGSYVNGRYTSSNQKLNTIHLISTVGYTFRGVTFSGGISVNRLLNGYEESRTAITNVYNSKKLQVGATAGIDYHFTPFRNKTALGLGLQYQLVSKLKSENTVFNDIQGVKLQIKYSF
ncbi:MAG: hypothetical protein ACO1N0_20635 [Fluviicola sp.]